jgi:TatD DNase family protein
MVVVLLADSHCHLDWFKNPEKVVQKASSEGICRILSNATSLKSIPDNLFLAKKFDSVECAIGIHPVDLISMSRKDAESAFSLVEENVNDAVALGEIGLDYKYANNSQKMVQESFFRRFVELALERRKAIVVHARYAETKCLDILEELGAKKVLMHWFTNSKKTSQRAVQLGYKISCGPIILSDFPSFEITREIPLESLLLETDAPVSFGGLRSEPFWVKRVCAKVAEAKGLSFEEVSLATGKNFSSLFLQ